MLENVLAQLEVHGYRGRAVPIRRLRDLQETFARSLRLMDEGVAQTYLQRFTFQPPEDLADAQSLIVISFPDPPVRLTFGWQGEQVEVVVPPTYLHGRAKNERAREVLAQLLTPMGYRVAPLPAPVKLLAVCSGLAAYGKNNITYVAGTGSFHRLALFCSDAPCAEDEWREPQTLDRCARCTACQRACPSGAIDGERFLLHAERCITFWNEKPTEVPWPEWLEASWHNCLVGCMLCQRACPENHEVRDWCEQGPVLRPENGPDNEPENRAEFSEQETRLLLDGAPPADLPAPLLDKLRQWDLLELLDGMPRNLRAVLKRDA